MNLGKEIEKINDEIEAAHAEDVFYSEYSLTTTSLGRQMHKNRLDTLERRKKNILEKINILQSFPRISIKGEKNVFQAHLGKGNNVGHDKNSNDKKTIWDKFFWPVITGIFVLIVGTWILYFFGILK